MSGLLRKEIRLLLPAWVTAMLLVVAPILLGRLIDDNYPTGVTNMLTMFGIAIGCVIIGLAGMGREIAARTFSLMLAQPRPRADYWRAKMQVLLVALAGLGLFLGLVNLQFVPRPDRWEIAGIWFVTACVAVTGGLWTTLLLRQIVAAFWISVLLPFALLAIALQVDNDLARPLVTVALLLLYSVVGYWFAHWQFRRAQDTAWTGGEVNLSGLTRWLPWKRSTTTIQKSHPLRALVIKEFQFQQVNFLLGGLLLLVQIVMLLLQRFANLTEHSVLEMAVQNFWGIWMIMPLLVGCGSVAEERKLGTLESQLCLPVARAWQFAIKVFVTLVCGLLLGALVPVALSLFNPSRGMNFQDFALPWMLMCASLALVSFYASTLTHQILQALGAAMGIIVTFLLLGNILAGSFSSGPGYFRLFGVNLWRGPLILVTFASVMLLFTLVLTWRRLRWLWAGFLALLTLGLASGLIQMFIGFCLTVDAQNYTFKPIPVTIALAALCPVGLLLALAADNFKHTQTSYALWRRNAALWSSCILLAGVVNALVYNRAWELAMPFAPAAGPPRLSGPVQPVITGMSPDRPTFVLLPDGRLISYRQYEPIPQHLQTNAGPTAEFGAAWRRVENPKASFIGGSNWVAIGATGRELAGVKSDGSLWSAYWFELVDKQGHVSPFHIGHPGQKGSAVRPVEPKLERVGSASDWASVAASWSHFVALKRDGTIWGWGNNDNQQLGETPSSSISGPVQMGTSSNWVAIFAKPGHSFTVNRAGEIWKWGFWTKETRRNNNLLEFAGGNEPVKLPLKLPGVRSIIGGQNDYELVLDTAGRLWGLGNLPPALSGIRWGERIFAEPRQLAGTNWAAIGCNWEAFAGVKTDGTLWIQRGDDMYNWPWPALTRRGTRTNWIAVLPDWQTDLALANDGTICRFGEPRADNRIELLARSRRVTWSVNLLDAAK